MSRQEVLNFDRLAAVDPFEVFPQSRFDSRIFGFGFCRWLVQSQLSSADDFRAAPAGRRM
jgi:hypothetical protein